MELLRRPTGSLLNSHENHETLPYAFPRYDHHWLPTCNADTTVSAVHHAACTVSPQYACKKPSGAALYWPIRSE